MNLIHKFKIKSLVAVGALSAAMLGVSLVSCVDDINVGDNFLDKQPGVDVTIDTIFAKGDNAKRLLWHMYGGIHNGMTYNGAVWYSPIDALTDIAHASCGWHNLSAYYGGGLTEVSQDNGGFVRFPFIANADGNARVGIWQTVRECWLFIENIDRVPDLSETEKSQLRGEAYVIMATRYFDAFRNFGGLPLIKQALNAADIVDGRRATVLETAEFIEDLLQKAIAEPGLPFYIADQATNAGRMSKGSAYGLRVKLWNFVASPLFNDSKPYLEFTRANESANQDIHMVWTGGDPTLWDKALEACKDFDRANAANGNYFALIQPVNNDYRHAFRHGYWDRGTSEMLIEVHSGKGDNEWNGDITLMGMNDFGMANITEEFMEMFGMADGRNFPYHDVIIDTKSDNDIMTGNPDNIDIFKDRDPRLYETMAVPQSNLGDEPYADMSNLQMWLGGNFQQVITWGGDNLGAGTESPYATGLPIFKFLRDYNWWGYKWYQPSNFPYLRMSDIILCHAEALAQTGDLQGACDQLNKVRARVGLGKVEMMNPELNLNTNKENFINQLLNERAIELFLEDSRWYDLVRYKRSDIFTKQLHKLRIFRKGADGNKMGLDGSNTSLGDGEPWPNLIYERRPCEFNVRVWWKTENQESKWDNKWFLDPISRDEINKGYGLCQNPGW